MELSLMIIAAAVGLAVGYWIGRSQDTAYPHDLEYQIGKFELRDNDILVVRTHHVLSSEAMNSIKSDMERFLNGRKCIVLPEKMGLDVIQAK